ncbi:hypothetical protein E2542_SST30484 [Spatholobus suberectus]|nr:hypothetical protein E2542_SST30484 [Spatholobus suberectus]
MEELSSSLSSVKRSMCIASAVQARAVDAIHAAAKYLLCLLILTGSLLTDINHSVSPKLTPIDGRFPFDDLCKGKHAYLKNKDASDSDEDEDEEDDDDANDQDDEEGDEDFSGEGEEEADPDDDPEAMVKEEVMVTMMMTMMVMKMMMMMMEKMRMRKRMKMKKTKRRFHSHLPRRGSEIVVVGTVFSFSTM